jgi:hypothetical protein
MNVTNVASIVFFFSSQDTDTDMLLICDFLIVSEGINKNLYQLHRFGNVQDAL